MTTQHQENYGRDVRNFHHPEDDMRPVSDVTNQNLENESYVDQYERDHDDEEIVNQDDDIINNEDDDELNNQFFNALERDSEYEAANNPDTNFYADEWDNETDLNDIDDDLEEDYDENDRNLNDYATDNSKQDPLDLEYDLDQDLEETDPVNSPRNFKY